MTPNTPIVTVSIMDDIDHDDEDGALADAIAWANEHNLPINIHFTDDTWGFYMSSFDSVLPTTGPAQITPEGMINVPVPEGAVLPIPLVPQTVQRDTDRAARMAAALAERAEMVTCEYFSPAINAENGEASVHYRYSRLASSPSCDHPEVPGWACPYVTAAHTNCPYYQPTPPIILAESEGRRLTSLRRGPEGQRVWRVEIDGQDTFTTPDPAAALAAYLAGGEPGEPIDLHPRPVKIPTRRFLTRA